MCEKFISLEARVKSLSYTTNMANRLQDYEDMDEGLTDDEKEKNEGSEYEGEESEEEDDEEISGEESEEYLDEQTDEESETDQESDHDEANEGDEDNAEEQDENSDNEAKEQREIDDGDDVMSLFNRTHLIPFGHNHPSYLAESVSLHSTLTPDIDPQVTSYSIPLPLDNTLHSDSRSFYLNMMFFVSCYALFSF